MNASKENACNAITKVSDLFKRVEKATNALPAQLKKDVETILGKWAEDVCDVLSFLQAAARKLPRETSYVKDRARVAKLGRAKKAQTAGRK